MIKDKALKNPDKKKHPQKPQYTYAWLNKENGSICFGKKLLVGVMRGYKCLGRIELEVIDKLTRYFHKESPAHMRKRLRNELKNDFDVMVSRIKFVQGERHG